MKQLVCIIATLLSVSTFASTGEANFIDWSFGNSSDTFYPKGMIIISGDAATEMYNSLKNATSRQARLDYSDVTLHGSEVTRDNVKAFVGESYSCLELPKMRKDGYLQRDSKGNVLFYIQCDLEITDISRGKIN